MDNKSIKKLEADLWEAADLLRQGSKLTSNQYCMPVLGLLFLRYAFSRFKMVEAEILKTRPMRNGRQMPVEASDFAAKSALYLPKEAQYDYLVNLPANITSEDLNNISGQKMNSLGEVVNNAMELVEQQSEQITSVLPKSYTDFSDDLIGELLRIFNNNVAIEKGEEGYIIDFDFFELNDGCAIQVIYNGEQDGVRVDGKVVGGNRIYKPWSHNNIFQKILEGNLFKKILSCGILFWPILFFVGVMFPIAFLQSGNYWHIPVNLTGFGKTTITVIMDIIFIIVEILISLYVAVWIFIFRYHCLPPKKLQNYVR